MEWLFLVVLGLLLLSTPFLVVSLISRMGAVERELDRLSRVILLAKVREQAEYGENHAKSTPALKIKPTESVQVSKELPVPVSPLPETVLPKPSVPSPEPSDSVMEPFQVKADPKSAVKEAFFPSPLPKIETPQNLSPVERLFDMGFEWLRDWVMLTGRFAPKGLNREFAVATNWLLRAGVVVVLLSVAFFLRYAIVNGMFPPAARCVCTFLAGCGLIGGGYVMLQKRYHQLAQAFIGIGLVMLYFTFFAAVELYSLMPLTAAFGCMAGVTAAAGIIAVRRNLLSIALLGLVGGYATPLLLSSDNPNAPLLYGYFFLLGCGVVGVSLLRRWAVLPPVSTLFAYILTSLFLASKASVDYLDFCWLSCIHLLCLSAVALGAIYRREATRWGDWLSLCGSAIIYWCWVYFAFDALLGKIETGAVALALAAFSAGLIGLARWRRHRDAILESICCGLAAIFTVMAVGVMFRGDWLTPAWAMLAVLMGYLAVRTRQPVLDGAFRIFLGIVLLRSLMVDYPGLYLDFGHALPWKDFLIQAARRWVVCCSVPAMLAALYRIMPPKDALAPFYLGGAFFLGLFFLSLDMFFIGHEQLLWGETAWNMVSLVFLPVLAAGITVVLKGRETPRGITFINVCLLLFLVKVGIDCLPFAQLVATAFWRNGSAGAEIWWGHMARLTLPMFLSFGLLWMLYRQLKGNDAFLQPRQSLGCAALVILGAFLSLETFAFSQRFLPAFRMSGLTLCWSLYAIALVIQGLRLRVKPLRYAGLGLLSVATVKLLFFDLHAIETLYRIISFFIVGVLLVLGAFLYIRFAQFYQCGDGSETPSGSSRE